MSSSGVIVVRIGYIHLYTQGPMSTSTELLVMNHRHCNSTAGMDAINMPSLQTTSLMVPRLVVIISEFPYAISRLVTLIIARTKPIFFNKRKQPLLLI